MCLNHDMSPTVGMLSDCNDVNWYQNGQVALKGKMLATWQRLDNMFVEWGREIEAEEIMFPPFIAVEELQKMDYLQSFPQLATFAATVKQDEAALARFCRNPADNNSQAAVLTDIAPVREVLTPAACYHTYIYLQNQSLPNTRFISTRNTCYRKEKEYSPLQRQWAFNMRELVCLGGQSDVDAFLTRFQQKISDFARANGIKATWQTATDPFFKPEQNEKYLAQRLFPIKQELVLENGLAIASLNRHSQHFGTHFNIRYHDEAAYSGCVAFGLERWLYAINHRGQSLACKEVL